MYLCIIIVTVIYDNIYCNSFRLTSAEELRFGGLFVLTRVQGVREFLDKIGHLDGDDDHGEADELDGQLEWAILGPDRGTVEVQGTEHE